MSDITVFSFVEDAPSKEILIRIVEKHNLQSGRRLVFYKGFPSIMGGFGEIKKKCGAFMNMALAGQYTLLLTDLDTTDCPMTLIRQWFFSGREDSCRLPHQVIFRVAVREVEAWIMADKEGLSEYLGISKTNFVDDPESLSDPKKFLINVLRQKARTKKIRDTIPKGTAAIGPMYNANLCQFVRDAWSPENACLRAPSLLRAFNALKRL